MESMRVASPARAGCRLNREPGALGSARSVYRSEGVIRPRITVSRSLRHDVRALLRRGERRIVLDLSAVSQIDAAGVGELIRTFNMTAAMNGALRIVNATAWVREVLERAHLFDLLSGERKVERRLA